MYENFLYFVLPSYLFRKTILISRPHGIGQGFFNLTIDIYGLILSYILNCIIMYVCF